MPLPPMLRAAALLLAVALATSGCGSKTVAITGPGGRTTARAVPDIHFAKAKFALHAGLALGAFHRYIDRPLRRGELAAGASQRLRAIVKAGTAALFAVHELRMAREDALVDDHLRPLAERVELLLGKLNRIGTGLKRGSLDASAIVAAASAASALSSGSASLGARIKAVEPAL